MKIIDGKYHANLILEQVKKDVVDFHNRNIELSIAIILVGDNPASRLYVSNKIRTAKLVDIKPILLEYNTDITQSELINHIDRINNDDSIHGMIVQMPLPSHIDTVAIQKHIIPKKDIDGFNPINVGMLNIGMKNALIPCTPQGCLDLIKSVCPDITGKLAIVIGRSNIVGKPMAALLLQNNATVIMAHSSTKDLKFLTKQADIVISAIGSAEFLTFDYFKPGAIVLDVGINHKDQRITGDISWVDIEKAELGAISPVPGGVGPMTIAYLLKNLIQAANLQYN
jgi:methylenetetrahydrofolate dehydrogenase (NADP+)/methenyltetrahydrofolate cyclohydrolase